MFPRRQFILAGGAVAVSGAASSAAFAAEKVGFRQAVFLNFKDGVSPEDQDKAIAHIREDAQHFPKVRAMRADKMDRPPREHALYSWGLVTDFENAAVLRAYDASRATRVATIADLVADYTVANIGASSQTIAPDPVRAAKPIWARHIIMFNFKPEVESAKRDAVIAHMDMAIGSNPVLLSYMVGRNQLPRGGNAQYEWLCVVDFASKEDRDLYNKDPVHTEHTQTQFLPNVDYTSM